MPDERISVSIRNEIKKLGELLRKASEDRNLLLRLLKEPSAELARAGISLEQYAKTPAEKAWLAAQVSGVVTTIVSGGITAILGDVVADTSYAQSTSSSYEYNFDNSSSSDYKYESHTGTSRGTFSDTTTGNATQTDTGFAGISLEGLGAVLVGPLISPLVVERIQTALQQAVTVVQG